MGGIVVVGLDLAKNVFRVHGVGADGGVLVRRQLRRGQVLTFFSSAMCCSARRSTASGGGGGAPRLDHEFWHLWPCLPHRRRCDALSVSARRAFAGRGLVS